MKNLIFLAILASNLSVLTTTNAKAAPPKKCEAINAALDIYKTANANGNLAARDAASACIEQDLHRGADPQTLTQALTESAKAYDANLSKFLLENGANPSSVNGEPSPFLNLFSGTGTPALLDNVQTFASSKKVDPKELSIALSYCTDADRHSVGAKFNFAIVKSLVENGADVNFQVDEHTRILDLAEKSCASLKTGLKTDTIQTALSECDQMLPYLKNKGAKDSSFNAADFANGLLKRLMNISKSCANL